MLIGLLILFIVIWIAEPRVGQGIGIAALTFLGGTILVVAINYAGLPGGSPLPAAILIFFVIMLIAAITRTRHRT